MEVEQRYEEGVLKKPFSPCTSAVWSSPKIPVSTPSVEAPRQISAHLERGSTDDKKPLAASFDMEEMVLRRPGIVDEVDWKTKVGMKARGTIRARKRRAARAEVGGQVVVREWLEFEVDDLLLLFLLSSSSSSTVIVFVILNQVSKTRVLTGNLQIPSHC